MLSKILYGSFINPWIPIISNSEPHHCMIEEIKSKKSPFRVRFRILKFNFKDITISTHLITEVQMSHSPNVNVGR